MKGLFAPLIGYFLTAWGLLALSALDSTLIFFAPLGVDVVVILLSARAPERAWLFPLIATAGSLLGAAFTYWVGLKAGEEGLGRWLGHDRVDRVRARVTDRAATAVAALGAIPPPFPLTPVLLAAGAVKLHPVKFFSALAVARGLRFGLEGWLGAQYGERIVSWMDSTVFEVFVGLFIAAAVIGTVVSGVRLWRSDKRRAPAARTAPAK